MPNRTFASPLERKRATGPHTEPPEIETLLGKDDMGGIGGFTPSNLSTHSTLSKVGSERLLPLGEAATAAQLSVRTLARYRQNGSLEVVKVGRRVFCSLEAIQRATVRRSLQQLWRELLDPGRRNEPIASWLADLEALAIANPAFEHPDIQRRISEAFLTSYPTLRVRDLTVGHLRSAAQALSRRGMQVELVRVLAAVDEDATLWETLDALHRRFGA